MGGGRSQRLSREDVVRERGQGLSLQERDVLEGRGVEDDVGAVLLEEAIREARVADVSQDRRDPAASRLFAQLPVDALEVSLGMIDEEQALHPEPRKRAAESRRDGAPGPGDENRAAAETTFGRGRHAQERASEEERLRGEGYHRRILSLPPPA